MNTISSTTLTTPDYFYLVPGSSLCGRHAAEVTVCEKDHQWFYSLSYDLGNEGYGGPFTPEHCPSREVAGLTGLSVLRAALQRVAERNVPHDALISKRAGSLVEGIDTFLTPAAQLELF
jgi:hypothetical protein